MYALVIKPTADKIFRKLRKRDAKKLLIINKKLDEILANPFHDYEHLTGSLANFNSVHIDSHSILIFRIFHDRMTVEVYYFDKHNKAYAWRPK